eukprot:jgi/Ulvmu1/5774/UM025_0028.1
MIHNHTVTDYCLDALNATDATQCGAWRNCTRPGGLIPYQSIYYCSPALTSRVGTFVALILVALWLAVLFMSLAHVAEAYLTPAMGTLAQNLKLTPRLAGVTLLAWANGAPDISANVAAMRSGHIRMALGSAIGAGLFVTCLIGGRLVHMARSMRVKGAMVRDVLVYALAVSFLLFVHTTARITPAYVAASLFAYAAYLLSVLAADLHHRGHMPYQRRGRRPRPALTPRVKSPLGPLRPLPLSPRIPATADHPSPCRATAPPLPGAPPDAPIASANAFYDDMQLGRYARSSSTPPATSPPQSPSTPFRPSLLPISGAHASGPNSTSRVVCSPGTIQHVMAHSARVRAATCMMRAHAALKPLLHAPHRLLQLLLFASIPQRPKGAGVVWVLSGVHVALLLRLTLAGAVVAVYFRHRLSRTSCVALACGWLAVVITLAAVWWLVSDPPAPSFRPTPSSFDADVQMRELELHRARPVVMGAAMESFSDLPLGGAGASTDVESVGVVYPGAGRPWRAGSSRAAAVGESALAAGLRCGLRLQRDPQPEASYPPLPPSYDDVVALSELGSPAPVAVVPPAQTPEGSAAGLAAAGPQLCAGSAGAGGGGAAPQEPSLPRRSAALALAAVLSVAAFAVAVLWVQLVAEELVSVLGFVGGVLRLDHTLLGVTLLAWGNCSADLVSNTALARSSRLSTAMSAVYAGPLLDILVAVPAGYAYALAAAPGAAVAAAMPATAIVGAAMLVVHCLATLAIAAVHGWTLPAWFWRWGAGVYVAYMAVLLTMVALGSH